MPTRPRKTTTPPPRKRAPRAPRAAAEASPVPTDAPVIRPQDASGATVVAFYLPAPDGALRPYEMPAVLPASIGLAYLHDSVTVGRVAATTQLMSTVLGEDGYRALLAAQPADDELNAIMTSITDRVLGRTGN